MKYRYRRNQLFRKKLDMPERVLSKIYNNTLTYQEYVEYGLEEKVPVECLTEVHRNVIERFGIERARELDWELIDLKGFSLIGTIKDIDPNVDNINAELYKFVIDDMRPRDYTKMMKKVYSDFVLEDPEVPENLRNDFNSGYLKIRDIVLLWKYVKNKDLSLCLKNDYYNNEQVTDQELKKFMNEYSDLLALIEEPTEIYNMIINAYRSDAPIDERNAYIKQVVDKILEKTINNNGWKNISLTNDQYHVIFKYTDIKNYIYKKLGDDRADKLMNELNGKDPNYLLDIVIPFDVLIDEGVLTFIEIYGLENIVNFDNECGHYFTNNDCEVLKTVYDMYIKCADNEDDSSKSIFTKKALSENGVVTDRPYTKEEFYEAIRRMIVYGPTDWNYTEKTTGYRCINGEFRELNQELFVDEKAPENFQDAFYTKTLTPIFIRDNYNCISYLIGKKLSSTFSPLTVRVSKLDNGYYKYENIYKFLEEKLGFEETIKIVTDYADVFEVMFSSYDRLSKNSTIAAIQFNGSDTKDIIIDKINDKLYELIIKGNIKYSSNISKTMKEKYPNVFITNKASKELQALFYNREIDADYIINNPDDKKYFEGLDIELFFSYMPITIVGSCEQIDDDIIINSKLLKKTENLISLVKNIFDNDKGLELLLAYNPYLNEINNKLDFTKVEFKEDITCEEFLNQIDCLIYLNIIKGELLYCEEMPSHFKASYPFLFLLDNAPVDVKEKFYNRGYSLEDFYNDADLLKYFANTDIACGLDITFSYMIGLFDSNDFLRLIKLAGESIKSDSKLFNYLRSKISGQVSLDDLGRHLYDYFKQNEESLNYLILLNKLGFSNEDTDNLNKYFENLFKIKPSLCIDSPCLNGKLFNNVVIEKYGYDLLFDLVKYNSGAHRIVINSIENNDELLEKWILYVKRLPIYSDKLLHYAILSYEQSKNLINNLINNYIYLDEKQLNNLNKILIERNKYSVQNMDDLNNYEKYRNFMSEEKIDIGNINTIRDGLLENIFNVSLREMNRIFVSYGLYSKDYVDKYLSECINNEDIELLDTIRDVYTIESLELLKKKFRELKGNKKRNITLYDVEDKIKKYYGKKLKESLFKYNNDNHSGVNVSKISGLEISNMRNINNKPMTSVDKIEVIDLEGIDFKILVHALIPSESNIKDYNDLVLENPSLWNKIDKNCPITTNMISNIHLGCLGYGEKGIVYYGFNEISDYSLMLMSKRDLLLEHNGHELRETSINNGFMFSDLLQATSTSYNEILLDRTSSDSSNYEHRLQPNFIVCFDGYVSELSRRAAQYFDVPIYMIDRKKYRENNKNMMEKYQDEENKSLDTADVSNILYSKELNMDKRYDLFLRLSEKSYNRGKINKELYLQLLEEAENIMLSYSVQNDVSNINLDYIKEKKESMKTKKEDQE